MQVAQSSSGQVAIGCPRCIGGHVIQQRPVINAINSGALVDLSGFTPAIFTDTSGTATVAISFVPTGGNATYNLAVTVNFVGQPITVVINLGTTSDPANGQPLAPGDQYQTFEFTEGPGGNMTTNAYTPATTDFLLQLAGGTQPLLDFNPTTSVDGAEAERGG